MKLNDFNASIEEIINMDSRVLLGKGDIWREDFDGVPHRMITTMGDLLTVKVPDVFPMKDNGRKLRKVTVWCNACELVTSVECHYGNHIVAYEITPDNVITERLRWKV